METWSNPHKPSWTNKVTAQKLVTPLTQTFFYHLQPWMDSSLSHHLQQSETVISFIYVFRLSFYFV